VGISKPESLNLIRGKALRDRLADSTGHQVVVMLQSLKYGAQIIVLRDVHEKILAADSETT
jgi:hypothetical protein